MVYEELTLQLKLQELQSLASQMVIANLLAVAIYIYLYKAARRGVYSDLSTC